jgi:hypothetical protein
MIAQNLDKTLNSVPTVPGANNPFVGGPEPGDRLSDSAGDEQSARTHLDAPKAQVERDWKEKPAISPADAEYFLGGLMFEIQRAVNLALPNKQQHSAMMHVVQISFNKTRAKFRNLANPDEGEEGPGTWLVNYIP